MYEVKVGPRVLRRPRLAQRDVLLGTGVIAFLSLASAAIAAPLWLGLRAMGVSWAWVPLLVPCAVLLMTLTVALVSAWRRSRERVVIDTERRCVEVRRVVLDHGGMLFGAARTRTIPFGAIVEIQITHNGHMPPGVRLLLSEAVGGSSTVEIANDQFDRGRLSAILAETLNLAPSRAQMPHH